MQIAFEILKKTVNERSPGAMVQEDKLKITE